VHRDWVRSSASDPGNDVPYSEISHVVSLNRVISSAVEFKTRSRLRYKTSIR
jgi:hypothetical protein